MGITWKPASWALLALAAVSIACLAARADDDDDNQSTSGTGDDTAMYQAQQAYWQAWDHWLTIYQEQQQAIKDAQARVVKQRLDRQLYDPPMTEIWSAAPLNALLKDMVNLSQEGIQLPNTYIQPELLQHINLTSGISEGNVSALGGAGKLTWPLPLTDKDFKTNRSQIDTLMAKLVGEVKTGKLKFDDFKAMDRALTLLDIELLDHVNGWAPNDYMEAKRFASNIRAAVKVLRQPDAPSYFNKDYAAKGKTVGDLVAYMNVNGLQFGPAARADERAYIVFHRALAACDMAANAQAQADADKAEAAKEAAIKQDVAAKTAQAQGNPGANPLVNPPNSSPLLPNVPGGTPLPK